jgi:hypothetical protein
VVVGTIGGAVPVEVLAAAGVENVQIVGEPGAPTPLADRLPHRRQRGDQCARAPGDGDAGGPRAARASGRVRADAAVDDGGGTAAARRPAGPDPADRRGAQPVVGTVFGFANPAQVRQGIERAAGGNPLSNNGVNYRKLLPRSGREQLVRDLYQAAGLDLHADLETLAAAPRVSADPAAVAVAEQQMAYTGEIRGPVIVVDNIGDPVDSEAYKEGYERTVASAGNTPLLRTTWIASAGHGNQTVLEWLADFVKLIERLDTGKWSSTSPQAMSEAAARLDAESDLSLGTSRFFDYHALKPLREWDGKDFGTYAQSTERGSS